MSKTPDDSWRDDAWNDDDFEPERQASGSRLAIGAAIAGGAVLLVLIATLGVGAALSMDHGPDPACRQAMLEAGYAASVVADAGRPTSGTCEPVDMCEAALLGEFNQATASEIAARMNGQKTEWVVEACSAPLSVASR